MAESVHDGPGTTAIGGEVIRGVLHVHEGMRNVRRVLRCVELHLLIARPHAPGMELKSLTCAITTNRSFFYKVGHVSDCPRRRIKNMHFNGKRGRQFALEADVLTRAERVAGETFP